MTSTLALGLLASSTWATALVNGTEVYPDFKTWTAEKVMTGVAGLVTIVLVLSTAILLATRRLRQGNSWAVSGARSTA